MSLILIFNLILLLFETAAFRAWLAFLPAMSILLTQPFLPLSSFLPPLLSLLLIPLMLVRLIVILHNPRRHTAELVILTLTLSLLQPRVLPAFILLAILLLAFTPRTGVIITLSILPSIILTRDMLIPLALNAHLVQPLVFLLTLPGMISLVQQRRTPLAGFLLGILLTLPGGAAFAYLPFMHESFRVLSRFLTRSILAPFHQFILYLYFLLLTLIPLLPLITPLLTIF